MKILKNVKRGLFILLLLSLYYSNAQNFCLYDSVKIRKEFNLGFYEQIYSNRTIAYYWDSYSNHGVIDTVVFFTYSPDKATFNWYQIPSPFKSDYESIVSMAIEKDRLVILGENNFFVYQIYGGVYKLIKTEKVKRKGAIIPNHVYFLDYQNIFLTSTYDYCNDIKYYKQHPIYSDYTFYIYDIERDKYTYHNSINIGRGITMCYYPFQPVAFNSNYMAVSHMTKPLITLYSKKLKKVREISLPQFSMNTDSVFNKYLSDSVLNIYRYSTKEKIKIINDNKLYQYPLVKGISFFNEDTLMCIVNNKFEKFMTKEDYRDVYLYSITKKSIVDSFSVYFNNLNIPKTFFFGSGLIQFNNQIISYVNDYFDEENNKMNYYLKIFKYTSANCNINSYILNQEKTKEKTKNLKQLISYKNISNVTFDFREQSPASHVLKDYEYILWIDHRYFCASCFDQYKNQNIIVILSDHFKTKKERFIQKQYTTSLFPKSRVLFLKKEYSFEDLNLNEVKSLY